MSKITIKQIAAAAGVSICTVDRVLHDRGKVTQEKKDRILEICRQYGYEQNIVGKAMAMRKKKHVVAVLINPADYGNFHGLRFCFGQRKKLGPLISDRKIDFAIEEYPFQHGYRSGEAIFKYLFNHEVPSRRSCVFCGGILLEENSKE